MPSLNLTGARGVARLLLMTASLVSLADAIDVDICASLNTADMNRSTFH